MDEELRAKVSKLKKAKAKVDERPVPAGAHGGVVGTGDPEKMGGSLSRLLRENRGTTDSTIGSRS